MPRISRRSTHPLELIRAMNRLRQVARRHSQERARLLAGISPELATFVNEFPEERDSVLAFVTQVAAELPAGTRILDAGAGNAPYRELFRHCRYVTADWEHSPHQGAAAVDISGSLEHLAVEDGAFDAALSTQVLEHVPEPLGVLRELHRITTPGGRLYLTVPLVWELHEEPYDFFRYTPYALQHLLTGAGYTVDSIIPRNGYFTTLASLARTSSWTIWDRSDHQLTERVLAQWLTRLLARLLPVFDELDERRTLPLGYACVATRPPE
jgi:SAM-dependent methyltransferase